MIEQLTVNDVDEIVSLQIKNSFSDGWNKKMLIDAFNCGNFLCFAEKVEDKIKCFVSVSLSIDTCDIEDVLVDKEFRGLGLAKKVINYALEYVKKLGKEKVFLEVRENNVPAITLYERLGFKNISTRKNYYSDKTNALVYLKEF